jgi:hypothetical protein
MSDYRELSASQPAIAVSNADKSVGEGVVGGWGA